MSNLSALEAITTKAGMTIEPKNSGRQLVLVNGTRVVDYWPGTGKWIFRGTGERGQGLVKLKYALDPATKPIPPKAPKKTELKPDVYNPNADPSKCLDCGGKSSLGIHGKRHSNEIQSRYYCGKCYVIRYRMGGTLTTGDFARLEEE